MIATMVGSLWRSDYAARCIQTRTKNTSLPTHMLPDTHLELGEAVCPLISFSKPIQYIALADLHGWIRDVRVRFAIHTAQSA